MEKTQERNDAADHPRVRQDQGNQARHADQCCGKGRIPQPAELAGLDMSAWIRERLRKIARDELREAEKESPF